MTRYIIRRSLQSIALLWLATLIGFSASRFAAARATSVDAVRAVRDDW